MSLCFLLSCLFLFVCRSSVAAEEEPMCTKFMYDRQIIETMVRMEVKMEQWDKERKAFEENVLSILENRKEEMNEVVRSQNGKVEKLIADFNDVRKDVGNRTAVKENVAERIKDTPKVAFNAYTQTSGSYSTGEVVKFPIVLLNEGGGYNKDTGKFTAPISGLYQFIAHVCRPIGNYMIVSIVHRSNLLATTSDYGNSGYSCTSVSAPAQVNKGDTVLITSRYSGSKQYADARRWPSFSGFLVNE